jgi:hypothetical protein
MLNGSAPAGKGKRGGMKAGKRRPRSKNDNPIIIPNFRNANLVGGTGAELSLDLFSVIGYFNYQATK